MEKIMMSLSQEDIIRFYNIWLNLLDYTNAKYKIAPKLKSLAKSSQVNPEDIFPIKNKLWNDNTVLDDIITLNPFKFSEADLSIINSWKNRISDKFILLKHLKNYSIFMDNHNIYGVTGIVSPLDEMFPSFALPLMIDAVLIPFEGKIIYDSILIPYQISFGSGAKKDFQENYRILKNKLGIITSLE